MREHISWKWVIILLIAFPPIGLAMLFVKLIQENYIGGSNHRTVSRKKSWRAKEQKSARSLQKTAKFFNVVAIIMGVLAAIALISDPSSTDFVTFLVMSVICVVLKFVFEKIGKARREKFERYNRYLNIVGVKKEQSIAHIANMCNCTEKQVIKDLQEMMSNGYFSGCYIDNNRGMFVTPNDSPFESYSAKRHRKVCKCNSCGAPNVVYEDELDFCQYCGSPLE